MHIYREECLLYEHFDKKTTITDFGLECFVLFTPFLSQDSAVQSASSEENAASETTKKIGKATMLLFILYI